MTVGMATEEEMIKAQLQAQTEKADRRKWLNAVYAAYTELSIHDADAPVQLWSEAKASYWDAVTTGGYLHHPRDFAANYIQRNPEGK